MGTNAARSLYRVVVVSGAGAGFAAQVTDVVVAEDLAGLATHCGAFKPVEAVVAEVFIEAGAGPILVALFYIAQGIVPIGFLQNGQVLCIAGVGIGEAAGVVAVVAFCADAIAKAGPADTVGRILGVGLPEDEVCSFYAG